MNKKIYQIIFTVPLLLVAAVPHLHAAQLLYVAADGNDTWSGTLAEPNVDQSDGPLASLDGARLKVREQIPQGLDAPVTVLIRGGEYQLDETVVFSDEDSGTSENPITYRAYPNEKPIFTGAIPLKDWKNADANLPALSAAAKGKLWAVEIPDALKGQWQVKTLYDGLTLLPRSRSSAFAVSKTQVDDPNNEQPKKMGYMGYDDEPVTFNRVFHFEGEDLKDWKYPEDIELFMSPYYGWMVNYLHHIGEIFKHAPGIFIAQSGHNRITHNTIHDLAYNGVVISGCRPDFLKRFKPLKNRREWIGTFRLEELQSRIKDHDVSDMKNDLSIIEPLFHARENLITYNEIYRVMKELHDGNGIYFSGMGKNNRAEFNYIHDLGDTRGFIRLDDISAFTIIKNNVCENGDHLFMMKGPSEVKNNFAINIGRLNFRSYKYEIDRLIFYTTKPDATIHYVPDSAIKGGNPKVIVPEKNTYASLAAISNSLVYDITPIPKFKVGDDLVPVDMRGGAAVGIRYADPMFDEEAMKQKIFRFKPGSPAIQLGIQPIDLSHVGSTLTR